MKNANPHQKPVNRMKKFRQQNKDIPVSNQNVVLLDRLRLVYEAELGIVKLSRSWVVNHLIEQAAHTKLGLATDADYGKSESEAKTGSAINVLEAQAPVTGDAPVDEADGVVTGDAGVEGLARAPSVTRNALVDQPAPASPGNGDEDGTPIQNLISFEGGEIVADRTVITVFFKMPDDRRFAVKASGFGYNGTTQSWCRKFSSEASREQFLPVLTQYLTDPSDQNLAHLQAAVSAP